MTTYLYSADDGTVHAYTTDGRNYYLSGSNRWWAYESDNYLYDAETNQPIAYWSGKYLYDTAGNGARWYRT